MRSHSTDRPSENGEQEWVLKHSDSAVVATTPLLYHTGWGRGVQVHNVTTLNGSVPSPSQGQCARGRIMSLAV
jgi:hypothetical protein